MKIVVNKCYGDFALSKEVFDRMGEVWDDYGRNRLFCSRINPKLISIIEEIGSERASRQCSKIKIVEIPDEATDYDIISYEGMERVIYVINGKINYC